MGKYKLNVGNVVLLNNGDYLLVQKGFWLNLTKCKNSSKSDNDYDCYLRCLANRKYDVVKVFEDFTIQKVLWERKI